MLSYNGLAGGKEAVETAEADVDTMLQRRADLIPNLVSTVKSYTKHETEEASAVAVQAGIFSGVGMNRRFSCTAQAELSNALDKISQLCYNDENQFREGVIRV